MYTEQRRKTRRHTVGEEYMGTSRWRGEEQVGVTKQRRETCEHTVSMDTSGCRGETQVDIYVVICSACVHMGKLTES